MWTHARVLTTKLHGFRKLQGWQRGGWVTVDVGFPLPTVMTVVKVVDNKISVKSGFSAVFHLARGR